MNQPQDIYAELASQFNLMQDEPMKRHTSFRIGGPADLFAQPRNVIELKEILKEAARHDIPITLIGGGTNLLITDSGIRGLVISTTKLKPGIRIIEQSSGSALVRAEAGELLPRMVRFTAENGLSGIEFAAGIPGTIGGAVIMNAGTPDGCMADVIDMVEVLNPETLEVEILSAARLEFGYRASSIDGILLAVSLTLTPGSRLEIEAAVRDAISRKKKSQPVSEASAGCFFKNPSPENPAGKLIEAAGLKGLTVNDAKVSECHANYLVNTGNASCSDMLELKKKVEQAVMNKFQIKLETEVRVKGE